MASQYPPTPAFAAPTASDTAIPEEEEYYSSWSLFLVCGLLILSLWTSYYLQIKRIRAIHETLVAIFSGMFVGLVVRLAPGTMIRDMLVSIIHSGISPNIREYMSRASHNIGSLCISPLTSLCRS